MVLSDIVKATIHNSTGEKIQSKSSKIIEERYIIRYTDLAKYRYYSTY